MFAVPDVVRAKAAAAGMSGWVDGLPDLVAGLADAWDLATGAPIVGGTESLVLEVELADGTPAVLKLIIPADPAAVANGITVLRLVAGVGCPRLYRADEAGAARLMERLGPSLSGLELPLRRRHVILCAAAARVWRPAPDSGLPTGAAKGYWLTDFIHDAWEGLGRPCSERAIDHATDCATRRIAAHDDERAVLAHGDVHQWNALRSEDGFKLVDPDGLLAEAEYDLGIIMREDPLELLEEGPWQRAHRLAELTGLDAVATWEWGVVERISTGLLCTEVDLQPAGREMLEVAEAVAAGHSHR